MKRIALIGMGHMARHVLDIWEQAPQPKPELIGVMEAPQGLAAAGRLLAGRMPVVDSLDALLALDPDVVVECATQGALKAHGPRVLEAGKDLLIISNGALADMELLDALRDAAQRGGARMLVPSGAVGGLDVLAAGRLGGLEEVRQSLTKPPAAWKNTPAETEFDLGALTGPQLIFSGSARQAARLYPQNANVTATVALAGVGFDESKVELFADPAMTGPLHKIWAKGAFGSFSMELQGVALPDNPKTSLLATLSLARSILNLSSWVVL